MTELQSHKDKGLITGEQMREYQELIASKEYRDHGANDFDCHFSPDLLQFLYPRESLAQVRDRWVQSRIKWKIEAQRGSLKPRSRSDIIAKAEPKINSNLKRSRKTAFKKTGDPVHDLYQSLGRPRKPIPPDTNREEQQYFILGLDTIIPKETNRLKPDKAKGSEHDFGLDNELFHSEPYHKASKHKFEQSFLQEEKKKRQGLKRDVNQRREAIEKDKQAFVDKHRAPNPLTEM